MNTVLMNNVSGEHFSKIENQKQNCLGVFLDVYWEQAKKSPMIIVTEIDIETEDYTEGLDFTVFIP